MPLPGPSSSCRRAACAHRARNVKDSSQAQAAAAPASQCSRWYLYYDTVIPRHPRAPRPAFGLILTLALVLFRCRAGGLVAAEQPEWLLHGQLGREEEEVGRPAPAGRAVPGVRRQGLGLPLQRAHLRGLQRCVARRLVLLVLVCLPLLLLC